MGHALNGTIQDVLTRYHRMLGENACWLPGTDHAGIATQNVVEKQLRAQGLTKEDLGREEFAKRVWAWRQEYGGNIINQLKRLGCACDYERERFTFDDGYVRAVLKVFVALYKKGYIHKDVYLVNWCPRCGTAISDLEVAHVEDQGHLYHVRYELEGGGSVTIATTRPETMLGDTAVAVNPDDGRYADIVGRTAILPLLGRRLPVIADARVEKDFGSGALKITPAHDITDFEIGRDHKLDTVQAIGHRGRDHRRRRPVRRARDHARLAKRVVADLEKLGRPREGRGLPAQRRQLALTADADAVTDALIAICTDPAAALARRAEIREALARTLHKKQIRPLGRWFAWTLALEGPEGWLKRAQMLGQLMSNTQHLGLVVRGEYLHLSRSAGAMLGTLGSLYKDMPRQRVAADLLWALNTFPARALQDALRGKKVELRDGATALARRAVFAGPTGGEPPHAA